jgi:hypothetical protein
MSSERKASKHSQNKHSQIKRSKEPTSPRYNTSSSQFYSAGDTNSPQDYFRDGNQPNYIAPSTLHDDAAERDKLCAALAGLDVEKQIYAPSVEEWPLQQASDSYASYTTGLVVKETPACSQHGAVFSDILEEFGLLKGGGRKGHSCWNPDRLSNNCIYVSVAYILNMKYKKLLDRLGVRLSRTSKAPLVGEIEWIFGRLPDVHVVTVPFNREENSQGTLRTQQDLAMYFLSPWIREYKNRPFAIGYSRINPGGHCVVATKIRDRGDLKHDGLYNYTFKDYQFETKGSDATEEVCGSFIRFAIFKTPGRRAKMDFYEYINPGVVHHSQLQEDGWYADASNPPYAESGYQSPRSPATTPAIYPSRSAPDFYPDSGYQSSSSSALSPGDYPPRLDTDYYSQPAYHSSSSSSTLPETSTARSDADYFGECGYHTATGSVPPVDNYCVYPSGGHYVASESVQQPYAEREDEEYRKYY